MRNRSTEALPVVLADYGTVSMEQIVYEQRLHQNRLMQPHKP